MKDEKSVREKVFSKPFFFMITCYFTFYLSVTWIANELGFPEPGFIGLIVTIFVSGWTVKWFMVSVPEVTGLLTVNLFTGELKPYYTGLDFRYPWEQVKMGNYITLRIVTEIFGDEKTREQETYPAADGPVMFVKWSFQYKPMWRSLAKYIAVDKTVIDNGLHDIGSSFLLGIISNMRSEDVKANSKLIGECLRVYFETGKRFDPKRLDEIVKNAASDHKATTVDLLLESEEKTNDEEKRVMLTSKHLEAYLTSQKDEETEGNINVSYEDMYGIKLLVVSVADIDYEENYQKVRTTELVANKLKEIAKGLEARNISPKDAFDRAMIINKDVIKTVSENIQEMRGEGTEAVVNFLLALANAAGGKR